MKLTRTDTVFSRTAMMFMCRKEKFSECPRNPWRHFLELIRIFGERISARGPTGCLRDRGRPLPRARPPISWAPWTSYDLNSNSIYSISGRKNQGESFIAFHDTKPPPNSLGRVDLESVRGSREGNPSPSSSSTILHHQFHDAHHRA